MVNYLVLLLALFPASGPWRIIFFFFAAIILLGVIFLTWVRVRLSAAYHQLPCQIAVREPGERILGNPEPALPEARIDLDFALLSQVAYETTPEAQKQSAEQRKAWLNADHELAKRGWSRWPEFGGDGCLLQQLEASHLRVQVWINEQQKAVAVTFGGTVFNNDKDWISNLRWFIPFHHDEYTETVNTFGPAFADEFVSKIAPHMGGSAKNITLYSTGHSLGGGLAQQFAYSLPLRPDVPRVTKVFAFDPSPVTGYFSVCRSVRRANKKGLLIDRIYERGEILAYLRSITNFVHKPSAINAAIRQIRYNLFKIVNPVAGHSIPELAEKLWELVNAQAQPVATRQDTWRRPKMW